MSDSRTILPAPKLLNLIGVRADENAVTLIARASPRAALCPMCGKRSARVHSRYMRTLADLPWQGVPVAIHLHVRRFFCDEGACDRAIFAERLSGVVARYARGTERLDGWFTHVSFALGGEAGARLLKELGVVVSGDTLLNHIRSMRLPSHETPRILSVDDFAFRRGTCYGTVLWWTSNVTRWWTCCPTGARTLSPGGVHRITKRCCALFEGFAGMLRDKEQRSEEQARRQLGTWIERAKAPGSPS